MESKKISIERRMELAQVVEYLENLAQGLKAGLVNLEHEDQTLALEVPGVVNVEIEAKTKKGKTKLEIEFEWRDVAESEAEVGLSINDESSGNQKAAGCGNKNGTEIAAKAMQATADAAAKATSPVSSSKRKTSAKKPAAKKTSSTKKDGAQK